jgi:hypothetical protein
MPYAYLPGFRVIPAESARQNHWLGGPPSHRGATCRTCDRPLLLLWDIDCSDRRFIVRGRRRFKRLERMPLYYCWTCGGELDYIVFSSNRLKVVKCQGQPQGGDFPYANYPVDFPRMPIQLDRLSNIPKDAKLAIQDDSMRIPRAKRRLIESWLGRPVRFQFDIWWHQFGGQPWLVQGPERIICANKQCGWSRRKWPMKILASIINDPPGGLPMLETMEQVQKANGHFNSYVQVVFHICPGCLSIHAANRCD